VVPDHSLQHERLVRDKYSSKFCLFANGEKILTADQLSSVLNALDRNLLELCGAHLGPVL
jgi:hypothetical protein